jgi:hypothetical protein
MSDRERNPVVLLSGERWHIVESSRDSGAGLCGQPIRERRAHSRLKTIGREHVCPACLEAYDRARSPDP